jgi:hypothetical protein
MKSLHQEFNEFQQMVYPQLKGAGLKALKRAFIAGYGASNGHILHILQSETPREGLQKIIALQLSTESFCIDCE